MVAFGVEGYLKDTPVLILNEGTSSLDLGTEEQIQSALFENRGVNGSGSGSSISLRGRNTILVTAHRLLKIQDTDQILVMAKGEILERGTHVELIGKGL